MIVNVNMQPRTAVRAAVALVAGLAPMAPSMVCAQDWSLYGGVVMRGEYNDNYFFTAGDTQSAFTASITPFVTAARKTETSSVAAVLAIGGNRVWGPSPTSDYASGRVGLEGTWRDDRSTWAAGVSFVRSPSLQTAVVANTNVVLGLAYTNAAGAMGSYTYAIGERWSAGATASVYGDRYSDVGSDGTFSNNHGYYAGGTLGYAYSERTQATLAAGYSYYSSDISHSDSMTATLGIVHQVSPQLTISVSGGGFWSDTTVAQGILACPVAQEQCDADRRRASGGLYGGQIAYAPSEQLQLSVSLSESLAPSGAGVLSKSDNAGASLHLSICRPPHGAPRSELHANPLPRGILRFV